MNEPSQREEVIFEAALFFALDQRAAFLDKACGTDIELRKRVEARLLSQVKNLLADQLQISTGPIETTLVTVPLTEGPGTVVGRYKILEQIGEGGFGVVYAAEQREPVKRRVALKIIKLGMDTKQVVGRFEAERQALALMDHPNIAKVLDAGATETGRPYFVMELVRGIKITEYCDQNNLPTAKRLDLFMQICRAIQHAHQKGIIHRDIKPSNILVTLHDGVPVPKVIDFGIAKATQGELTDKTVYTSFHQFIGTPAYMSPEQAEMSGLDIDTRTDIYSLGVLLYELLTGKTPFESKRLVQAGLDEMRRIIREEEPPRPSTRLSKMDAAEQTTVAKRRQSELPKLIHLLRGDLDWIVMKCLEKDRTLRYETANGLASDVERHRNNEPVVARPTSRVYKFKKLVRRNKLAFVASAAVSAALVLGMLASAYEAIRAKRAEAEKTILYEKARRSQLEVAAQAQKAEAAAKEEALQRKRAVEGELLARQHAYAAQINLACQAWKDGDAKRVFELLNALKPKPDEEDLRSFEWYYLSNLCHRAESEWSCGDSVSVCAFSPDGKLFASGFTNGFKLWEVASGQMLGSLRVSEDRRVEGSPRIGVISLAFLANGGTIAAGLRRVVPQARTVNGVTSHGESWDVPSDHVALWNARSSPSDENCKATTGLEWPTKVFKSRPEVVLHNRIEFPAPRASVLPSGE